MDEIKRYWVGFNLIKGIGPVRMRALIDHFGDAHKAWLASPTELKAAGLSPKLVSRLVTSRANVDLEKIWEELGQKGIGVMTWMDDRYPRLLREIGQSPPLLYFRGAFARTEELAVAIVGTRRVTRYGRQVTEDIATFLAQAGVTVVSGLARGVDTVAHKAALQAQGRTVAVLGCGVDRVYPPENRRLVDRILETGAILSDYPLGTPPEAMNFPPRNRIIAGLSLAVVVVEAGPKSGALITAGFAADQGREVFAVPGNITGYQSRGTNYLIQQGARPLLSPQDVLDVLEMTLAVEHRAARRVLPAVGSEADLLQLIGREPIHIDEICLQSTLPVERVSATLSLMELKGLIRQVGGMHYVALLPSQAEY